MKKPVVVDRRLYNASYKALAKWKLKLVYRQCGAFSSLTGEMQGKVMIKHNDQWLALSQSKYSEMAGV